MLTPGRHASDESYRYGFQGQEKDDELKGEGNSLNYTFRMHDSRLGKFLSLDPLSASYPHNSPYAFAENRVIDGIELEGAEYLDTDECRIRIAFGMTVLNYKTISNPTANKFNKNSKLGSFVDYGYMEVSPPSIKSFESQSYNVSIWKKINRYEGDVMFTGVYKKDGTPHKTSAKSPRNYTLVGGGLKSPTGLVKINAVVGVIEALGWGWLWFQSKQINNDYDLSMKHEAIYLEYVVPAMQKALNSGDKYIPYDDRYRNDFSLSLIANAVLFGERHEKFEELYQIGMKIYDELGEKILENQSRNEPDFNNSGSGDNFFTEWLNNVKKKVKEAMSGEED